MVEILAIPIFCMHVLQYEFTKYPNMLGLTGMPTVHIFAIIYNKSKLKSNNEEVYIFIYDDM